MGENYVASRISDSSGVGSDDYEHSEYGAGSPIVKYKSITNIYKSQHSNNLLNNDSLGGKKVFHKSYSNLCIDNNKNVDANVNDSISVGGGKPLSYVQQVRLRFEILSKKSNEFHENTNWWLDENKETTDNGPEEQTATSPRPVYNRNISFPKSSPTVVYESVSPRKLNLWPQYQKINKFFDTDKTSDSNNNQNHIAYTNSALITTKLSNNIKSNGSHYIRSESEDSIVSRRELKAEENVARTPPIMGGDKPLYNDFDHMKPPTHRYSNELEAETETEGEGKVEAFNEVHDVDDFSDSFDDFTDDEYEIRSTDKDSQPKPERPVSTVSQQTGKMNNIINEILENEQNYVDTLKKGIADYVTTMKGKLPNTLRGQKYHIFGNLECIFNFHHDEFLPELLKCNEDIEKISEVFLRHIRRDYFYGYVLFAINRPKSEKICCENTSYFEQKQKELKDKLGINSLLLQPIQRLPRYQMLLNEVIKELVKNMDVPNAKSQIKVCCEAEKALQRLLDTVNESMSINDIKECTELNILQQGKFRRMRQFDIDDSKLRRRYQGKVFFFDLCIIYTEFIDKEKLEYRGHYMREEIGCTIDRNRTKLSIYALKPGQEQVELSADENTLSFWHEKIEEMLKEFAAIEKRKINDIQQSRNEIRSSVIDFRSSRSSDSLRQSIYSTASSDSEKYENNALKWNNRKHMEKLLNTEKHYIMLMQSHKDFYFITKSNILDEFKKVFDEILVFHKYTFFIHLKECAYNVKSINDVFRRFIDMNAFFVYNKYAAMVSTADKLLKQNLDFFKEKLSRYPHIQSIEDFLNLPLKHIDNYCKIFFDLLEYCHECETNLNNPQLVPLIASLEIEMSNIAKRVRENYEIYKIKTNKFDLKTSGLVLYSDVVSLKSNEVYRLFIMERAVTCCMVARVNKNETYSALLFSLPHQLITIKESLTNKKLLKVYGKTKYSILFTSSQQKTIFINNLKVFAVIRFK